MTTHLARDLARALDPAEFAVDCGIEPDPWQTDVLRSDAPRILLNCSRQVGKSTCAGLLALHTAIYAAPALVLLVSPSQRQSTELFETVKKLWQRLPGAPEADQESLTRVRFRNESRIISLPGSESTTRGYPAVSMLILDEAARVPDALLAAVRPSLATTNGRLVALSTPAGKRGWFHQAWTHGAEWLRVQILAQDCRRISGEFLEAERRELGDLMYRQEYCCEFVDDGESAFGGALIEAALKPGITTYF